MLGEMQAVRTLPLRVNLACELGVLLVCQLLARPTRAGVWRRELHDLSSSQAAHTNPYFTIGRAIRGEPREGA